MGWKNKRKKGVPICFIGRLAVLFAILLMQVEDNAARATDLGAEFTFTQTTVKGKVKNGNGEAIIGATVAEKGTEHVTTTDGTGSFTLRVKDESAIVVVSNIGYKTVEVPANQVEVITLYADESALEEVVVVGFGTQKKVNLTSAVSQIDSKVLQGRASPTVVNMLQGASPGLVVSRNSGRPGAQGLGIQVRGATSANGGVDPLIVIDGIVSSSATFTALNPNDIENISVLKDGGATAIYGASSAGGVLLVTTKKGTKGRSQISLLSNVAWQMPKNIPERLSLIDEMTYVNLARANAGLAAEYSEEDLHYAVNGPTFVEGSNGNWKTYNQESLIDQVVKDSYGLFNNNVQISGGSDKITYLASVGNMDQSGMFKIGDDHFSRWNARANLSAQVNKYFKLDVNTSYINEATDNPQDGGYGIDGGGNSILRQFYSSRMRFPIFNEDGTYYKSGSSSAFGYALLEDGGFNTDRKNNYFNTVAGTLSNLVKGLELRAMYGRENINSENRNFKRTVTFYSGPESSSMTHLNNPNSYSVTGVNLLRQNVQFTADYGLTLVEKHNFHIMGGYQFTDYESNTIKATTTNLYVNDNPSLNFTADPTNKTHTQTVSANKMQSYFGRFNYNYDQKYLFEATIRGDESSKLTSGRRMKTFPSFSAGWNVAKEEWFKIFVPIIDELKPRLSWGKVGSQLGIDDYDYIAQLVSGKDVVLGEKQQAYLYQEKLQALNLTWETVETRNVGLDFSLLDRKLRGSFEYYNKYNNNMLVLVSLPGTLGLEIPKSNGGKLKTWGWEASITYGDNIGDDFNYNISFNIADNQNRLIKFGGANDVVDAGVNKLVEGYALNSIWGYKTDGYFQSEEEVQNAPSYEKILNASGVPGIGDVRYIDNDGDGEITPGESKLSNTGDLVYLGDINPRYQYGLNINLTYKDLDFSVFIQGIGKRKFKPSNELIQPLLYSYYLPMSFQMDYWTPENTDSTFPRPYLSGNQNFQASDKWFMSGAYARLKNIQLGYTLRKDRIKKLPFSRIRVYASGEDLLTISKLGVFKGAIDPEMKPEDNKISPYPFATSISFGLNLDF